MHLSHIDSGHTGRNFDDTVFGVGSWRFFRHNGHVVSRLNEYHIELKGCIC